MCCDYQGKKKNVPNIFRKWKQEMIKWRDNKTI